MPESEGYLEDADKIDVLLEIAAKAVNFPNLNGIRAAAALELHKINEDLVAKQAEAAEEAKKKAEEEAAAKEKKEAA
jgi:hypothetical protein